MVNLLIWAKVEPGRQQSPGGDQRPTVKAACGAGRSSRLGLWTPPHLHHRTREPSACPGACVRPLNKAGLTQALGASVALVKTTGPPGG